MCHGDAHIQSCCPQRAACGAEGAVGGQSRARGSAGPEGREPRAMGSCWKPTQDPCGKAASVGGTPGRAQPPPQSGNGGALCRLCCSGGGGTGAGRMFLFTQSYSFGSVAIGDRLCPSPRAAAVPQLGAPWGCWARAAIGCCVEGPLCAHADWLTADSPPLRAAWADRCPSPSILAGTQTAPHNGHSAPQPRPCGRTMNCVSPTEDPCISANICMGKPSPNKARTVGKGCGHTELFGSAVRAWWRICLL